MGESQEEMEVSEFNQPWSSQESFSNLSYGIFSWMTGKASTLSQVLVEILMYVGLQL